MKLDSKLKGNVLWYVQFFTENRIRLLEDRMLGRRWRRWYEYVVTSETGGILITTQDAN